MEIKNILGRIKESPQEPKKFFAIEIGYEVVKTAIWCIEDKATKVISFGSIEEWKSDTDEAILQAVDKSLSIAAKDFEEEPNEVIFGLPESWVGTDGIAESKKPYLKTLTKSLDLKPVGFVVTTEAIVHHLRLKEGGPPSTILTYLTEAEVVVSVVKQGEILGTHVVGRSDDLCKDVEEGLARFGQIGDLPSRIIVYDGNVDLETAKQTLINYDWKGVNFLHFPKIEDLDAHSSITAVAIAGGTEVAKSLGIQVEDKKQEVISSIEEELAPQETMSPEDFGFIDPRKTDVDKNEEELVVDGDNFSAVSSSTIQIEQDQESLEESIKDEVVLPKKKSLSLPKLFKGIKMPKFKLPLLLPLGIGVLVLLGVGGVVAYWQLPKATVIIYTKPKQVEKDISFILNPNQEILDVQNNSVSAKKDSIELEGEKETQTTGAKIVGEKAKGIVNIFNLTQSPKTFEAGTKLNYDKYVFITNEAVSVASATAEISADYKTTVTPSQEAVGVTAGSIGDQYNFSTGTELTIGNFAKNSFVAKASSDFKGGFSREIQAISKEDQLNLREALLAELKAQGVKNLSVIASQKKGVIELQEETITKETFSGQVGDEQDRLRIALKFTQPIYTYQLADIGLLIQQKYKDDFPSSFVLDPENIEVEVVKVVVDDKGLATVDAKVKLNLSPNVNPEEIANAIRGKYPEVTKEYFKNLPNFSKVETTFNVNLPEKLQTFPKVAKNITVTIQTEK